MDFNITQRKGIKKCLYEDLKKMFDAYIQTDKDKVDKTFDEFIDKVKRYI